jgi:hypothetical protein
MPVHLNAIRQAKHLHDPSRHRALVEDVVPRFLRPSRQPTAQFIRFNHIAVALEDYHVRELLRGGPYTVLLRVAR